MKMKAFENCDRSKESNALLDEGNQQGEAVGQYAMLPGRAIYPPDGYPVSQDLDSRRLTMC